MTNFLNNCIIQLFDYIEATCGVKFVQFTDSDLAGRYQGNDQQEYMAAYRQTATGTVYKYLYDPGLSFNFRFHQYLSDILFVHRDKPWTTLMFSTGPVRPLTYVLSHKYDGVEFVSVPNEDEDENHRDRQAMPAPMDGAGCGDAVQVRIGPRRGSSGRMASSPVGRGEPRDHQHRLCQ